MKKEIQECIAKREEMESVYAARQEENADLLRKIKENETDLKKLRQEQLQLEKYKSDRSVKMEKYNQIISTITEQAEEKYGLEHKDLEFDVPSTFSTDGANKEIKKLKAAIDSLGAINMVAIEEHQKLSERYEFISFTHQSDSYQSL